jgi:hypothetical protein
MRTPGRGSPHSKSSDGYIDQLARIGSDTESAQRPAQRAQPCIPGGLVLCAALCFGQEDLRGEQIRLWRAERLQQFFDLVEHFPCAGTSGLHIHHGAAFAHDAHAARSSGGA